MNADLYREVKLYLKITWKDNETEERVISIVESAIVTLTHKLGISKDQQRLFKDPGPEHALFLNYCMYDWNQCLDAFEKAYGDEIRQLRQKHEVLNYEKTSQL